MTHVALDACYLLRVARRDWRCRCRHHSLGLRHSSQSARDVADALRVAATLPAESSTSVCLGEGGQRSTVESIVMGGRVLPSRSSVWDKAAVAAAFQQAGVKPSHLTTLYK